jgi:hypothetical protein
MNNVEIEQVEETKLLEVTLDCKLSMWKHIDATVGKMGRGMSAFLTAPPTRQVLQALALTHLEYCPVVWPSAKIGT